MYERMTVVLLACGLVLARLVGFLETRCRIAKSRIYGHGTTPGARATDCPGRGFPMAEFLTMLDINPSVAAK
jgi:hypothetical protein